MAIIQSTVNPIGNTFSAEAFNYPNQYVSYEEKLKDNWIKNTVDYHCSIAYAQYQNKEGVTKNYELMAGIFNFDDFKEDGDVEELTKILIGSQDSEAPKHLKHYPIINPPINTLLGELLELPDIVRVKAVDEESKNQYIKAKEDLLKQMIAAQVREQVYAKLAAEGVDIESEEGQQQAQAMTLPEIEEYMRKTYVDVGEEWGNKKIEVCKDYFSTPEKSEEGFRDLLITSTEFHHFELNESKVGFNYEILNPRNVWYLGHPDIKYMDTTFACGFIDRYDISYILNKWKFTKEEIDHLIDVQTQGYGGHNDTVSKGTGFNSINYTTYNPLLYRQHLLNQGVVSPDEESLFNVPLFGQYGNSQAEKFVVVKGYFLSKRKIGERIFFDEDGVQQSMMVAENYKPLLKPVFKPWVKKEEDKIAENLISGELVEWTYINEWWEFLKVGSDIYKCNPLKVNICPIVGLIHNNKNAPVRSLVDLMKPLQALYNVCLNQLYDLLAKEKGVVFLHSLRHTPKYKDMGEDALDVMEAQMMERGIVFIDDDPQNLKAPSSFNQWNRVDLSRSQEMQTRYEIAVRLKMECWELIGFTKERLGSIAASQTATATQSSITTSVNQTAYLFRAHALVMQKVYQTMLDICKYVDENKPEAIISHVNSDMENIWLKMNPDELATKNLLIFITNGGKDLQLFNEIRALSQPALQNGADFLDIINLYSTDSRAEMKNIFQKLKDERQKREQQAQQLEEQKLSQQQEQFNQQRQDAIDQHLKDQEFEAYQNELDRIAEKENKIIAVTGFGLVESEDADGNGIQDILELNKLELDNNKAQADHIVKMSELNRKTKETENKKDIELQKLSLAKKKIEADIQKSKLEAKTDLKNQANDLLIAKQNAKGRSKTPKKK